MAYVMVTNYIEKRLKAPSTAEYPSGYFEKHTEYLGQQRYRVTSWVKSKNAFGVPRRVDFVGLIKQVSEDEWQLMDLHMVQR